MCRFSATFLEPAVGEGVQGGDVLGDVGEEQLGVVAGPLLGRTPPPNWLWEMEPRFVLGIAVDGVNEFPANPRSARA